MKYRLYTCFGDFVISGTREEIYKRMQNKMQYWNIKRTNEKTLNEHGFYLTKM